MSEVHHKHTPDAFERVRTPLLTLITQESLDQDYEVVARRAATADAPAGGRRPPRGRAAVVGVVAVFGLLVSIAAVQTSRNADVDDADRAEIIERIDARRDAVADDQQKLSDLRDENTSAESTLVDLGDLLNRTQSQLRGLQAATGFAAVTGPGIKISLDNASYADATSTIRDSDLALLVDALWSAGAEAIAINGQRLTPMTGIRNVSTAIEVNRVGIAAPYTVLAIGDRSTLASGLLDSGSGLAFSTLAEQYGFQFDVDNEDDLRLPAAPADIGRLRSAKTEPDSVNRAEEEGTS
ncbi:DUF881 domain-containing protein [Nocardioides panacisoli]|uniref:DUF881 domain-containing protein n=1 Tax=Nocardioides panacisoli TaxID=627624 RepID=A0ABP7J8D3_9ACTN